VRVVFAAGADESGKLYDLDSVRALERQLAAIGITVEVVPLPQCCDPARWAAVLAHADLTGTGRNAADADDPVAYLLNLPYLPAADRAKLDRIAALPSPRREAAAEALGAKFERDALYIGYAESASPELVSKRLGCVIDQPEYPGVDLAALCLRNAPS
jgi:hypothetical protein